MLAGIVVAGGVAWRLGNLWLIPGQRATAAVCAAFLVITTAAWLWMWSRVWLTALQISEDGVVVRNFLHTYRISWPEVRCFADGSISGEKSGRLWALRIVLHDGRVVTAEGTARRKQTDASPETLVAVRQAAERHAVAAELTGVAVLNPGPGGLSGWVQLGQDLSDQKRRATIVATAWLVVTVAVAAGTVLLYVYASTPGAYLNRGGFGATAVLVSVTWRAYRRRERLWKLQRAARAADRPGHDEAAASLGQPQAADPAAGDWGTRTEPPSPVTPGWPASQGDRTGLSRPAAVAAGVVVAAVAVGVMIIAGVMYKPPSPLSTAPSANQLTADELRSGDCLAGSNMGLASTAPWPVYVTRVDCTQQHEAEVVFADAIWPSSLAYPGDSRVDQQADERCDAAFATYDGVTEVRSAFSLAQIAPDSGAWASGDRSVQCIAYEPSSSGPSGGTPVDYSIKGSGK